MWACHGGTRSGHQRALPLPYTQAPILVPVQGFPGWEHTGILHSHDLHWRSDKNLEKSPIKEKHHEHSKTHLSCSCGNASSHLIFSLIVFTSLKSGNWLLFIAVKFKPQNPAVGTSISIRSSLKLSQIRRFSTCRWELLQTTCKLSDSNSKLRISVLGLPYPLPTVRLHSSPLQRALFSQLWRKRAWTSGLELLFLESWRFLWP